MNIEAKENLLGIPQCLKPQVQEEDYQILDTCIDTLNAFTQLTYQSMYIIDYNRMNFLYVSDNPLFLCGRSVEEVKDEGYTFYFNNVPPKDLDFLIEINKAGFNFLAGIQREERLDYSISYNFNLYTDKGRSVLINHQLTPFRLDKEGNMWLALCLVSLAPSQEEHQAGIRKRNDPSFWCYDMDKAIWQKKDLILLTDNEKMIIHLAHQGYSIKSMAKLLHKSEDTIKGYRREVFQKLQVSNISEAIAYATLYRLI